MSKQKLSEDGQVLRKRQVLEKKEKVNGEKSKKSTPKKVKAKPVHKTSPQREQKRERRRERMKEKDRKTSAYVISLVWMKFLDFCREHLVLTILSGSVIFFLVALNLSVDIYEDRHPSKHPNVTDHVAFDIDIERGPSGQLVFGLYGKDCPLTVKNFIQLTNHDRGYGYTDSEFFMIMRQRMILGGDIVYNNGSSGKSALDEPFEGENLKLRHKIRGTIGMLSLKNNEESKYTSQFYISLGDLSQFDGDTVIIGHLLKGLQYLDMLERAPTDERMRPRNKITIKKTSHQAVATE